MLKFVERSRLEGWQATGAKTAETHGTDDWNDLHLKGKLTSADISRYRYYGDLLLAKSATDKALLMFQRTERHEFDFEHDNRLYWFKLDVDRHMKAVTRIQESDPHLTEQEVSKKALRESGAVAEIANCYPTPLYFQKSEETDESWYYLKIDFPRSLPPVKSTFTASQLTSASEFKKRLLHIAKGAVYTGSTQQLDKILKRSLPRIKEVKTQNYVGYNKDYDVYVFNHIAVQGEKIYRLNQEDYFSLERLDIKTLASQPLLKLNTELSEFTTEWVNDLWEAFGAK
ncbi:bifunctional DNA primase/helicase, partial [Proteus mirabilis]